MQHLHVTLINDTELNTSNTFNNRLGVSDRNIPNSTANKLLKIDQIKSISYFLHKFETKK